MTLQALFPGERFGAVETQKKKKQALRQEKEKKDEKEELAALLKNGQQQMEEIQAAVDTNPSEENEMG